MSRVFLREAWIVIKLRGRLRHFSDTVKEPVKAQVRQAVKVVGFSYEPTKAVKGESVVKRLGFFRLHNSD